MVQIEGRSTGNLRCEIVHGPSGQRIDTDAPADNAGRGERFSPTDLVAAALGSCVVTTIAIFAARRGIAVEPLRFRVEKHMVADPLRRIGRLPLTVWLPASLSPEERKLVERVGRTCPVHASLGDAVDAPIEYVYG